LSDAKEVSKDFELEKNKNNKIDTETKEMPAKLATSSK